jgi:ABC-2 type transport system ATP-binding protein
VNLEIRSGEVFGLVGPNGSGKSSLLSIVAGLRPRHEGRVEFVFDDESSCGVGHPRTDGLMGVVFQNTSLDGKLTARQNLMLCCRLDSVPSAKIPELVEAAINSAGLTEAGDKKVGELSGGMKRRLDLARALLPRPRLLLLDEPTTGIDEASFRAFWVRIDAYRADTGATLVLATHRPEEAQRCSRVALFAHGKILEVEDPEVLKRKLTRDVIVLSTEAPSEVVEGLGTRLGLKARHQGKRVYVESDEAHRLVPRIVVSFPPGTLSSVELRGASMADVFLKITGNTLES